jgi:hypothetical protein
MKFIKYVLLATAFFSSVNCSSTARTSTDNVSSNEQTVAVPTATPPTVEGKTAQATTPPDAVLKEIYAAHEKDNGKILDGKSRTLLDRYFDKPLADMIWKDLTTQRDEAGVLDFDIFYNAQDFEIKNFNAAEPKIEGGKATVTVTFENFGTKQTIIYSMVERGEAWKIADINYGSGNTLLKYFKEAKNNAGNNEIPTGEFEGKYQVGDTTCTVKPVKMAFEVKWEKGSGVEMFFSEGRADDRYIFASNPLSGRVNSFAFDDENYNTGTFYRADGKEFPIRRIK